jgi:hypothetical protein
LFWSAFRSFGKIWTVFLNLPFLEGMALFLEANFPQTSLNFNPS